MWAWVTSLARRNEIAMTLPSPRPPLADGAVPEPGDAGRYNASQRARRRRREKTRLARRAEERRQGLPTGSLTPYRCWCEACGIEVEPSFLEAHKLGAKHRRNTTASNLNERVEEVTADKGGITVSPRKLDMATVAIGAAATAQLIIHRPRVEGASAAVGAIHLISATTAARGSQVTITFASSGAAVTDTDIPPDATIVLDLSHTPRHLGRLDLIIVLKFIGTFGQQFSIARWWRVGAQDPDLQRELEAGLGASSVYNRRRHPKISHDDTPIVPGEAVRGSSGLVLIIPNERVHKDAAAKRAVDLALAAPENSPLRNALRQRLAGALTPANYRERFHLLLKVEDAQSRIDIRHYDIQGDACRLQVAGRYLALEVPGLAEARPSVGPLNRLNAFDMLIA